MIVVPVTEVVPVEIEAPVPRLAKLIVPPVTVKSLNGTTPPIVPCKVTVPDVARRERFLPATSALIVPVIKIVPEPELKIPVFVLLRMTFPVSVILLLVVVILPPRFTAPVRATAPTLVMGPAWVIVVPLAVREVTGVVPPTAPPNPTVPDPDRLNVRAPSIVLLKAIFDPVATTLLVKLTAPVIPMGELVVVTLPPKLIAPV